MAKLDGLFYHPTAQVYGSPREMGLAHESVTFQTKDDVTLHGWFFPARNQPIGTVLHLHGNAGNITGHFQQVEWLPVAHWNVLCFDYRGYGRSEGRVTREGTIIDAHAALDYLLTRDDVDGGRIVAFGQSLGGAIGTVLAAEREEIRGLATDGAFDDYLGIARWHVRRNPLLLVLGWWAPRLLIKRGWDPIDYVGRIAPRGLLIIHGTRDRIVDVRMAKRLYEAAGEPKDMWLVEGADHYEPLMEYADRARPRLLTFFATCVASRRVAGKPGDRQSDSTTRA